MISHNALRGLAVMICMSLPLNPALAQGSHAGHSAPASHQAGDSGSARHGDIEISQAFTRAMLPGQPVGGGYLTIRNHGADGDALVSAASPIAEVVELHEMAIENDVMRMRKLDAGIAVGAGETVELKPGGLHLMFYGVEPPFRQGDSVSVTLTFEKAGEIEVTLPVHAAGSANRADKGGHGHH